MDKGAIKFAFNSKLLSAVPAGVREKVEKTQSEITAGKLTVPMAAF